MLKLQIYYICNFLIKIKNDITVLANYCWFTYIYLNLNLVKAQKKPHITYICIFDPYECANVLMTLQEQAKRQH